MKTTADNNSTQKRNSVRYTTTTKAFNKLFKAWRKLGFSYEDASEFARDQIRQAGSAIKH